MPKNGDKPVDKNIPITSEGIGMKINMFPQGFHRRKYHLTGYTEKGTPQHMGPATLPVVGVTERVQFGKSNARKTKSIQIATDLAVKALLAKGNSIRHVADVLGCSPTTIQRVKDRLSAQGEDLKSGLMSPHLGEMSVAVVEHFLKKGAKLKTVKGSDAMAAVKAVQDRQCPTQQAPEGPRVSFIQINIDSIRLPCAPTTPPDALDITPPCAPLVIDEP